VQLLGQSRYQLIGAEFQLFTVDAWLGDELWLPISNINKLFLRPNGESAPYVSTILPAKKTLKIQSVSIKQHPLLFSFLSPGKMIKSAQKFL